MRSIAVISFSLTVIFIISCSSPKKNQPLTGTDIVRMINKYEIDTLRSVMDKAFILDFDYISLQGNAKTFIDEIMSSSKALEAHYEIVETRKPVDGRFQYLVKDHSALDKYMEMEVPKFLLTIVINDSNRFEKIFIDTLPGYKQYDRELTGKFNAFSQWLKEKYPDERLADLLQDQSGRMVRRLKEYSKQ